MENPQLRLTFSVILLVAVAWELAKPPEIKDAKKLKNKRKGGGRSWEGYMLGHLRAKWCKYEHRLGNVLINLEGNNHIFLLYLIRCVSINLWEQVLNLAELTGIKVFGDGGLANYLLNLAEGKDGKRSGFGVLFLFDCVCKSWTQPFFFWRKIIRNTWIQRRNECVVIFLFGIFVLNVIVEVRGCPHSSPCSLSLSLNIYLWSLVKNAAGCRETTFHHITGCLLDYCSLQFLIFQG